MRSASIEGKKRALAEPRAIEEVGMELIYRSEKMEDELLEDLAAMVVLPNVKYVPLTPDISIVSVYLRKTLGLTFFDSHHAATALSSDGRIISFDQVYERVPGLTWIKPEEV